MILIRKTKLIVFSSGLLVLAGLTGCVTHRFARRPVSVGAQPQAVKNEEAAVAAAKKTIEASLQAYQNLQQYTSVFLKEERLDENTPLRPRETILVKFRKPHQIYMKWVKEPNKGMELIYPVKENKLVVEPGGLADLFTPRLYLNPTDRLAMVGNRHPVTEAGFGFFIEHYAREFSRALEKNEVKISFENPAQFNGAPAHRLEAVLPPNPDSGYYCYRSVVYFNPETKLPLEVEFYDWENKLFERYAFTDVKINPGLTDKDFDENNKEYDF